MLSTVSVACGSGYKERSKGSIGALGQYRRGHFFGVEAMGRFEVRRVPFALQLSRSVGAVFSHASCARLRQLIVHRIRYKCTVRRCAPLITHCLPISRIIFEELSRIGCGIGWSKRLEQREPIE